MTDWDALDAAGPPINVPAQVRQYEAFVNDVLKADLQRAQKAKTALQAELKEFEALERDLAQLHASGAQTLTLQVDIGAEVLAQAHVPDASIVYISVGLGFHVGVTLDEAPRVIRVRKDGLKTKLDKALTRVADIRSHIRMTEEVLAKLQALGA